MSILAPIQNCKFQYECPKDWFELDETDDEAIRFCQKCSQNVYFCKNDRNGSHFLVITCAFTAWEG